MFEELVPRPRATSSCPGTSYLERDGTTVNLEGRLQRQRRAVIAPCPDELAWIAKLAERFGVELSPHASLVFEEVSAICYGGISFGDDQRAGAAAARPARACQPLPNPPAKKLAARQGPAPPDLPAALLRARGRAHARARLPAAATARSSWPAPTRGPAKIADGRHRAPSSSNGTSRRRCAPGSRATCRPGRCASRATTPRACTSSSR